MAKEIEKINGGWVMLGGGSGAGRDRKREWDKIRGEEMNAECNDSRDDV